METQQEQGPVRIAAIHVTSIRTMHMFLNLLLQQLFDLLVYTLEPQCYAIEGLCAQAFNISVTLSIRPCSI